MARAKKLPSGNWRVQTKKTVNGEVVRKSFSAPDRRTAELLAAQWGTECKEIAINSMPLKTAFEKYTEIKSAVLSPSTLRGYKTITNNNLKAIMPLPIDKLTQSQIQAAINVDAAKLSPKTVRNIYTLLVSVLKMYRPDFSVQVTLPQKVKTEMHIPEDDEIATLLAQTKGTEMEIAIMLAAFGPLRRGEICALTSDDIHGNIITVNKSLVYKGSEWAVKPPKNYSSNRDVELPEFVITRLKGIKGRIYPNTPASISEAFPRLLEKCGLQPFRFHDLRHYCVSSLHGLGVPDKYIMERGGWSTPNVMNNVYNHILKKNKDTQTQAILNHFNAVNSQAKNIKSE